MSKMSLAVQKVARETEDPSHTALERATHAQRLLAEATTASDAVHLVSTARAMEEWAKAAHAGEEAQRQAAAFTLRAKRNAGRRIEDAQERRELARRGDVGLAKLTGTEFGGSTLADIGVTHNEASEWKRLAHEYPTDADLVEAAESMERPSVAGAHRLAALMSSDSPEWYTPPEVVAAVVAAMGAIDLDPCADPGKAIPATTHYTIEDDGLSQGWRGRVYMNPPYGREIGDWIDKLVLEYESGNVTEAVALVPGRIDTAWYRRIAKVACHISGRLRFSGADPAPFPSVALYLGPDEGTFEVAFAHLGDLWTRAA